MVFANFHGVNAYIMVDFKPLNNESWKEMPTICSYEGVQDGSHTYTTVQDTHFGTGETWVYNIDLLFYYL